MSEDKTQNFNVVAATSESTVVAEYNPQKRTALSYQSEAELEKEFISLLESQGYEYVTIHSEEELVSNLRTQLESLNDYKFSDAEWKRFYGGNLANKNEGIVEKSRKIQEDYVQVLKKDDGFTKNIKLIDKENVQNNRLQVINQYAVSKQEGAGHSNRYDVTILVNGFPLVHIELKRRGVNIREAFNQINRYQNDSFDSGTGLFEYIQIFVISNGTNTKYYSNTTRYNAVKNNMASSSVKKGKTSNSFEFTSFWADARNRIIPDLVDFTKTFFVRHTLLNILTKYCILTSENILLVMRPYQITATERILNRIEIANNNKFYGSIKGGGYIWHTTGSGKTLTSFKTARLASNLPYIDKVLFVVDRKDLDYQTMKEYDRFEKGSANSNTSTKVLKEQLEKIDAKIIITTIQKLSSFIRNNSHHSVYDKHIVIIFDECHRSQFGDMHRAIVEHFKKYHLFGFTGTPIFAVNALGNTKFLTTEQTFGDQLHSYTIVNAINDKNVLPFKVDYIKTVRQKDDIEDEQVKSIEREKTLMAPERISKVTEYILDNFEMKTYKRFNSIFAVSSVEAAKAYYEEFKKQMAEKQSKSLRIATIFSYAQNEEQSDEEDGLLGEENPESTASLDKTSREFLEGAIADYNGTFSTNYSTDGDSFQNYYKDVSLRMKSKELDMLIVVNMFLTGFDATTLNTLWVDKNLKMHGLIQAFSRTNRILNSVKTYGNIVCFRNLEKEVDDALSIFGDKDAKGIVLMRKFDDYYSGYDDEKGKHQKGYTELVEELTSKFPLSEHEIIGEKNKKDFIMLFGAILRRRNLLSSFDEFQGKDLIKERDLQDYCGRYQDLKDEFTKNNEGADDKPTEIVDDLVFEIELIKQITINIDYILMLVEKFHESNCKDKEIRVSIDKAIDSSPELRSKKELIDSFIDKLNEGDTDVKEEWLNYVSLKRDEAIDGLIKEEGLKDKETKKFIEQSFENGEIKTIGTDIDAILPAISRFNKTISKSTKKQGVIEKLRTFFEKFFGIGRAYKAEKKSTSNYE